MSSVSELAPNPRPIEPTVDPKQQPAESVRVEGDSGSVRSWSRGLFRLACALLIFAGLLAAVEMGLRVSHVGFPTDLTQPCTVHGQAASCYNLFFVAPFFPPGMIKTPQV